MDNSSTRSQSQTGNFNLSVFPPSAKSWNQRKNQPCRQTATFPWATLRVLGWIHHGLQHLQEEFVHGHSSAGLDAVEGGEGASGRLSEERQREEESSGTLGVVRALLHHQF